MAQEVTDLRRTRCQQFYQPSGGTDHEALATGLPREKRKNVKAKVNG
jgi:hypothetical protein